ncbi:hypothetical protein ACQJBY_064687 [Aegilops geniculata]
MRWQTTPSLVLFPNTRGSWEAPEQSAHLLATVMDTAVALPIALAATADDLSPMPPSSISLQPGVYTTVGSRPSRALTAVQVGLRPPSIPRPSSGPPRSTSRGRRVLFAAIQVRRAAARRIPCALASGWPCAMARRHSLPPPWVVQ